MPNLQRARKVLTIVLVVFLCIDVVAAIVLLSPLVGSPTAHQQEYRDLRDKVQAKAHEVVPPDKMGERVQQAREQIAGFYKDRLPAEASTITAELGKLAAKNGVKLSTASYTNQDTDVADLSEVKITANLSGEYVNVVKFINDLERDPVLFVVSNVSLVEQTAGRVRLQVTALTYLRQT